MSHGELFNFPPFFTLQPVEETRQKQLELWCKVICDWAQETNTWAIVPSRIPLWENPAIDRRLGSEGQAAVVTSLLASGHARWEDASDATQPGGLEGALARGDRLRLSWRGAPCAVAVELWEHARAQGLFGQVFTVFELHSGDAAEGTPFHKIDP